MNQHAPDWTTEARTGEFHPQPDAPAAQHFLQDRVVVSRSRRPSTLSHFPVYDIFIVTTLAISTLLCADTFLMQWRRAKAIQRSEERTSRQEAAYTSALNKAAAEGKLTSAKAAMEILRQVDAELEEKE
jgi:hypothetical protein